MGIDFRWGSRAGTRTNDNRDYACIGLRHDEALCVLLDGSTTGRDSGALARALGTALVDGYVRSDDPIDAEGLLKRLSEIHATLAPAYPQASASYIVMLIREEKSFLILHAGDCLVGRWREDDAVEWLCRPHTLSNALEDLSIAEIIADSARHRLTRSFRPREFMRPAIAQIDGEQRLIVATDGFWADLTDREQISFLDNAETPQSAAGDDCSVLQILITDTPRGAVADPKPSDTLYFRRREAGDAAF